MVRGAWCVVLDAWCVVHDTKCMLRSAWGLVHESCRMGHGACCMGNEAWCVVRGAWCLECGDEVKNIYFNENLNGYYNQLEAKSRRLKKIRKISDTWITNGTVRIKLKDNSIRVITHQINFSPILYILSDFTYCFLLLLEGLCIQLSPTDSITLPG